MPRFILQQIENDEFDIALAEMETKTTITKSARPIFPHTFSNIMGKFFSVAFAQKKYYSIYAF